MDDVLWEMYVKEVRRGPSLKELIKQYTDLREWERTWKETSWVPSRHLLSGSPDGSGERCDRCGAESCSRQLLEEVPCRRD